MGQREKGCRLRTIRLNEAGVCALRRHTRCGAVKMCWANCRGNSVAEQNNRSGGPYNMVRTEPSYVRGAYECFRSRALGINCEWSKAAGEEGWHWSETTHDSDLSRRRRSEENHLSMAPKKQKARLSTGGKAPRKQIGMLAARKTKEETTSRPCLLIRFVGFGDGQELWIVHWSYSTGGSSSGFVPSE